MRHSEKSENITQGRRSLVIASQAVGVVAVYRRHRRPNPFVSGQSFHFQMTVALGDALLVPLTLLLFGFYAASNLYERDASSGQKREKRRKTLCKKK